MICPSDVTFCQVIADFMSLVHDGPPAKTENAPDNNRHNVNKNGFFIFNDFGSGLTNVVPTIFWFDCYEIRQQLPQIMTQVSTKRSNKNI